MNEQDNRQPRRSIFRAILPYLLIVLAIGAFVSIVVLRNKSKTDKIQSDSASLDAFFNNNEIITAEVYRKEEIVEVSGKYVENNQNTVKQYSFVVDLDTFKDAFDTTGDNVKDHPSYYSLLEKEKNVLIAKK